MCCYADMAADREERLRILRDIGEALRGDLTDLSDAPPPKPILLQVLHLIRREQELRGSATKAVTWEDLPEDVRQLLERLRLNPPNS